MNEYKVDNLLVRKPDQIPKVALKEIIKDSLNKYIHREIGGSGVKIPKFFWRNYKHIKKKKPKI